MPTKDMPTTDLPTTDLTATDDNSPSIIDDEQTPRTATAGVNAGSLFYFTIPSPDADRGAEFYRELFGWSMDGGDHGYHVRDVYPPMGLATNPERTPAVWIEVEDIDAAVARVRELGGTAADPVHYDSGWTSECTDDQGVVFNMTVPRKDYRSEARRSTDAGELFYWTLPALDAARSKQFYSGLFGWEFGTPGNQGGMHVENMVPDGGLGGGREGTHPDLFFRVADLEAAMAKVRELGGTAESAGEGDEGSHAMCTDDQGVAFGISQPAEGY